MTLGGRNAFFTFDKMTVCRFWYNDGVLTFDSSTWSRVRLLDFAASSEALPRAQDDRES